MTDLHAIVAAEGWKLPTVETPVSHLNNARQLLTLLAEDDSLGAIHPTMRGQLRHSLAAANERIGRALEGIESEGAKLAALAALMNAGGLEFQPRGRRAADAELIRRAALAIEVLLIAFDAGIVTPSVDVPPLTPAAELLVELNRRLAAPSGTLEAVTAAARDQDVAAAVRAVAWLSDDQLTTVAVPATGEEIRERLVIALRALA